MSNSEINNGEIVSVSITTEMKKSYLDYAMSVIVARAIPDVCDGCKPVHRRILYAMYESHYDYNRPFKKSARIVGEVMGKYHPHGDAALYGSLVRMAQDFSMGKVLVDGQGNFGSIDDDPPAAMRYTESRLSKIAHTLLEDLDKDTVDFGPNYDGTENEPLVLPASFPNVLVNGGSGIAVGMATNIPTHNLGEVIDGVVAYIDNPELTVDELLQIIPGPDFPTGGVILGRAGYNNAARTGRGSVIIRGKYKTEESKSGKVTIIITEVPYQVNKALLVEKIADLVREKKIEGISDLRDESDRDGVRIVIELKKGFMEDVIMNQLYNYTNLQVSFGVNMLALNHGRPELMNLLSVIKVFTEFRRTVVTRRTNFLLNKARARAHILVGLRVAVNDISEIIALIRRAPDPKSAKDELMSRSWNGTVVENFIKLVQDKGNKIIEGKFYFTEEQAKAILDMRLSKLTGLESEKIDAELAELAAEISEYLLILGDDVRLMAIIRDELMKIRNEFATPRKTEISASEFEVNIEDLIPKEDMVVIATINGYIKRVPLSSYKAQKRGGKGRSGISIREEDLTTNIFIANTHTPILFFSSTGKVYRMKTYKLPLGTPQSKGRALVNLLPIAQDEKINTILELPELEEDWKDLSIVFATSKGNIRRNSMADFTNIRENGKIAIKLQDDDTLVNVNLCNDKDDILMSTRLGKCIRFPVASLRVFKGRDSSGVRGIKLDAFNEVISMSILKNAEIDIEIREMYLKIPSQDRIEIAKLICEMENADNSADLLSANPKDKIAEIISKIDTTLTPEKIKELAGNEQFILTITENGFGKRSSAYEYRITNRGGSGITNIVTSKRNGNVVASFTVDDSDHIIMITDQGTLIRSPISSIRIVGRNTQGVTLMKTSEEKVVSVARITCTGDDEVCDDVEGECGINTDEVEVMKIQKD